MTTSANGPKTEMKITKDGEVEAANAEVQPSTALALAGRDDRFRLALDPATFKETMDMCELLAAAGINGCESPPLVLTKVMAGRALGMSAMVAIMNVYNIKGTISISAKAKVALCLQSPLCEYFRCTHTDDKSATWVCKRVGEPEMSRTFTIEDAERSGLLDRGADAKAQSMNNWNRFPAQMCRARASSDLADMAFADVTRGMATVEEMRDVKRADEMLGEVAHPVAAAPKRDWAAEQKALIAKIDTITEATDPRARKPIREEVQTFLGEAPEPFRTLVGTAFNVSPKYVAPKGGAVGPAAGAASQQSLGGPAAGTPGGTEA